MPHRDKTKQFTAERQMRRSAGGTKDEGGGLAEILETLQALRGEVRDLDRKVVGLQAAALSPAAAAAPPPPPEETPTAAVARKQEERTEVRFLKIELNSLAHSIETTKKEIALLRAQGDEGDRLTTVANELDAVVAATENATETILDTIEKIASTAAQIQAQEQDSFIRQLADEIQEMTVSVFEACNFQDLTGQRITKVVNTMKFVEERVDKMMAIWGRESFRDLEEEPPAVAAGDNRLLNGPQDVGNGISQDEIDRLFG
ncbi:hypothetical protein CKO38_01660 [Rhodospirillum rubrum]|uniref:protein phosphatase CheZ n=1 Tax=Rhodospirillum rubrum TaxID=1085 RepID=UPI001907F1B9|nr:protein phosphatase CheZ [Rhodospirillum rubrum]MBK1663414.1 hypothetical protein [Rhodospirillum rubrum]MBK1675403.1 hypothetical protein [Rhodospirillum rubrum]